jgi:Zn-finger nucleic acid-binding protein
MMQTVDRLGVHIDQCTGCRGIFLDRGELEQIASAESRHYGPPPQQYMPPPGAPQAHYRGDSPPPYGRGYGHRGDSPPPYGGHRGGHYGDSPPPYGGHYGRKHKRKSFLEELFD